MQIVALANHLRYQLKFDNEDYLHYEIHNVNYLHHEIHNVNYLHYEIHNVNYLHYEIIKLFLVKEFIYFLPKQYLRMPKKSFAKILDTGTYVG